MGRKKHPSKRKRDFEGWKEAPSLWRTVRTSRILKGKSERAGLIRIQGSRWSYCTKVLKVPSYKETGRSSVTAHDELAPGPLEMAAHSPITMSMPSELRSTQDPADRPSLNRPRRERLDKKYSSSFNPSTVVLGCRWPCMSSRNQSGARFKNTSSFVLEDQQMQWIISRSMSKWHV